MTPQATFTGRIGQWCFRHRFMVVAIWLLAVVLGALMAGPVFAALGDSQGPSSLESIQGDHLRDEASRSGGTVVGVVTGVDPDSAAVRQAVLATAAGLRGIAGVAGVSTPYDAGLPATDRAAMIARDHRGLVVRADLADLSDDVLDPASDAITVRLHALGTALVATGDPTAAVLVGGDQLVDRQADAQAQHDLSTAEELSLPVTLIILIFVFGGVIAAGLPVLTAVVSIAGSFTVLWLFSKVTSLDQNVVTVISLLGLGLSIDYGLLLVARYRDELRAGYEPDEAVGRAWATAGRTIVFSALTVAASLCGMLVFGLGDLSALGAAGISIALVSLLVSLTFTAALLRFAGRRVRPRKHQVRSRKHQAATVDDERGFFGGLARRVQRRPLVTALATGAVLVAAALPLLSLTVHIDDVDGLPRSLESVQVIDLLAGQYNQASSPAVTVVARTDAASLDAWAAHFATAPGVTRVYPAEQIGAGLAEIDIDASGSPEGPAALHLVDLVRADRPAGTRSWVTGDAAVHRDVIGLMMRRLPWAVGLTLVAMMSLLFAMTGSLIVPVKAALMNVLSLGAAFGVLDAVFLHGFLAGPLHTTTVAGISPITIVTVFAFAFGLSMDYEVFLLARIKELVDAGVPNDVAVRRGLQRSGRIITSAALLMVVVFGCFVTGRIGNIQQIGLGLAVAVAVDATIVRCVLVPAVMTLLGSRNWWAPAPLRRWHARFGQHLGEHDGPAVEAPREPARVG